MRVRTFVSIALLLAIALVLGAANQVTGHAAAAPRGPCGVPKIAYGETRVAEIAAPGLTCFYSFDGQKNDTVEITLRRTGKWDPFLALLPGEGMARDNDRMARDNDRMPLAQDDDSLGDDNSRISLVLPASGPYTIVAKSSNEASAGRFELKLLAGLMLQQPSIGLIVVPQFNGSGARSTPAPALVPTPVPRPVTSIPTSGQVQRGSITEAVKEVRYAFMGNKGDTVYLRMISSSKGLDPWLDLINPDGGYELSDDDGAGNGNSKIYGYRLLHSGRYIIVARAYENKSTGNFELALSLK